MRNAGHWLLAAALLLALLTTAAADPKPEFPLRDGDVWVMAGDSITAQHLHSNYFEAFCFARYPQMKFCFRNAGVSGHTIPTTLARFDYDIAAWKPTVVSVELGMNDKGGTPTDRFVANMHLMVERIRAINARPVIFSPSPVNNGSTMENLDPGNRRLHEYAVALKEYAAKENIPYADQFHALIDVWGRNKPKEILANATPLFRQLVRDDALAGVEHLRAFLDAQERSPIKPVSMQGDPVHPGPPGQLMMTAALLKALGADGAVSSATLDANGTLVTSEGCKVDTISADAGKLAFDRLDERLPFPIPDETRAIVAFDPTVLEISRYMLKVTGLRDGNYVLRINGVPAGTLTAAQLGAGVNLTALVPPAQAKEVSPIVAQGRAILAAVAAKETLVTRWRELSQRAFAVGISADMKDQLTALTKRVEEADERIREAARPQKLRFEVVPANGNR